MNVQAPTAAQAGGPLAAAQARRQEGYRAAGHWSGQTLHQLVGRVLAAHPALRVANSTEELSLTEVWAAALTYAEALRAQGVGAGEPVVVAPAARPSDVGLLLAVSMLDAVACLVPPGGTAEGLSTALTRTGARLVVGAIGGHDEVVADLGAVSAAVAEDGTLAAIGELAPPPAPSRRPPGLDRAHFVTFTSGSTGTPKAVVHTADTMAYSARHSVERTGAGAGAVLGLVALSHAAGLAFSVFAALPQGRDLVLYDGRWAPGRALDMVDGHGVAWTLSVPTHLSDMVTAAEERDWSPGPGGLTFACGGASVSPDLVRSAAARGIAVCRMYGLSECLGHTATHRDEPVEVRAAHDGTVFPGSEVVTLDADGTVLPPGSPGQGASTGPALFLGYLEDETDHEALTAEGHLPTGDLMEVDEDGRVAVVGRVKDIIIRGGENVDPGQVEADVVGHPAVRRAAAVGYPDPRLGERICVWVETDDGALDRDGLATFLLGRGVPKLRIPDMVRVLERLPVSAVGKIDKRALRKTIEEVQQ